MLSAPADRGEQSQAPGHLLQRPAECPRLVPGLQCPAPPVPQTDPGPDIRPTAGDSPDRSDQQAQSPHPGAPGTLSGQSRHSSLRPGSLQREEPDPPQHLRLQCHESTVRNSLLCSITHKSNKSETLPLDTRRSGGHPSPHPGLLPPVWCTGQTDGLHPVRQSIQTFQSEGRDQYF